MNLPPCLVYLFLVPLLALTLLLTFLICDQADEIMEATPLSLINISYSWKRIFPIWRQRVSIFLKLVIYGTGDILLKKFPPKIDF